MLHEIKQDLIDKISSTNDEDLLLLLKTDYEFFTQDSKRDVIDELSKADKDELIELTNESFGENTISRDELDEAIGQWRTK